MASQLKLRRGTTAQHSTFTGASGEVTVDTTKKTVVVHDGTTAGGVPLATEAAVAAKQNLDAELTTLAGMSASRATFLASSEAFGFRNRIINGAMMIDQRNAGASVTNTNTSVYTVDRWGAYGNIAGKFAAQRNAGSVTPPAGYTNYLGITSLSSYSVLSSDIFQIYQAIEGFNIADLGWGAAGAQAVTLSFWVRSSLTGTHSGVIQNQAQSRTYGFTYTINSANTWEYKTITIPGDTAGTWTTDNTAGIRIELNLGTGSTYLGSSGAWSGSTFFAVTGSVSVVGTNGATFYITGVQLEKGSTATSFDYRPYGTELALCQRYFSYVYPSFDWYPPTAATFSASSVTFPATMRAAPTFAVVGAPTTASITSITPNIGVAPPTSGTNFQAYNAGSGRAYWFGTYSASAEL